MTRKHVKLKDIRIDGGTQVRADLDIDVVNDYAEAFQAGAKFPPVTVYFDGKHYWLGDGFHRYHAATKAGVKELDCEVKTGTVRDCILFACGANQGHGLKRTNFDKQCAVKKILNDNEWGIEAPDEEGFSDGKIAEICGVTQVFVSSIRKQLISVMSSGNGHADKKRIGRDGKARRPPKKRVAEKKPAIDDDPPAATDFNPDERVVESHEPPTKPPKDDTAYTDLCREMRSTFDVWMKRCPRPLRANFLMQAGECVKAHEEEL